MADVSVRHGDEDRIEARVPAYRFGIVLLLLLATFIFLASGPSGDWVAVVAVVLQGATLLAAFSAAGVSRGFWHLAVAVVLIALVSVSTAILIGGKDVSASLFLLNPSPRRRRARRHRLLADSPSSDRLSNRARSDMRVHPPRDDVGIRVRCSRHLRFAAILRAGSTCDGRRLPVLQLHDHHDGRVWGSHRRPQLGTRARRPRSIDRQLYLVTVLALLVSNLGRRGRAAQSRESSGGPRGND